MPKFSGFPKKSRKINVVPLYFDPFNKRLARDIRNTLSKALLRALKVRDASLFKRCGAAYLQQNLEPVYEEYVKSRLAKYEKAYALIKRKEFPAVLRQAAILWDLELYYEMHELLEQEWKKSAGERRSALQGLIRAAGMKIHAESRNREAALKMGAKAMVDLEKYGRELGSFVKVDAILAEIKMFLSSNHDSTGLP